MIKTDFGQYVHVLLNITYVSYLTSDEDTDTEQKYQRKRSAFVPSFHRFVNSI